MKENRCQNNVKTGRSGTRRSPSGSKETGWWGAAMSKHFLTQEHGRNYTTVPDARRFLTVRHSSRGWKKNHPTPTQYRLIATRLRSSEILAYHIQKNKRSRCSVGQLSVKLITLLPCPWIGAHAKMVPCVARRSSLVMKVRAACPHKEWKNTFSTQGQGGTCKLLLSNWKLNLTYINPHFCSKLRYGLTTQLMNLPSAAII